MTTHSSHETPSLRNRGTHASHQDTDNVMAPSPQRHKIATPHSPQQQNSAISSSLPYNCLIIFIFIIFPLIVCLASWELLWRDFWCTRKDFQQDSRGEDFNRLILSQMTSRIKRSDDCASNTNRRNFLFQQDEQKDGLLAAVVQQSFVERQAIPMASSQCKRMKRISTKLDFASTNQEQVAQHMNRRRIYNLADAVQSLFHRLLYTGNPYSTLSFIESKKSAHYSSDYSNYFDNSLCLDVNPRQQIRVNILFNGLEEQLQKGFPHDTQSLLMMTREIHRLNKLYEEAGSSIHFLPRIIDVEAKTSAHGSCSSPFLSKTDSLRKRLEKHMNFGVFEGFWDHVEFFAAGDDAVTIPTSPHDVFIAGEWQTAYLAHRAALDLGKTHFIYFISDFEPLRYEASFQYARALQTYSLPHYAITNTPMMLRMLKSHVHSFMSDKQKEDTLGNNLFLALQYSIHPITADEKRIRSRIKDTEVRRVLIYSRPEAKYSLELVFEFLNQMHEAGAFSEITTGHRWEFHGIGYRDTNPLIQPLFDYQYLTDVSQDEYSQLLSEYDIGVSLMLSPNINIPQLEFASGGIITVVNDYMNWKTAADFQNISSNFEVSKPSISSLIASFKRAMNRIEDVESRIEGAHSLSKPQHVESFLSHEELEIFEQMILESIHCHRSTSERD